MSINLRYSSSIQGLFVGLLYENCILLWFISFQYSFSDMKESALSYRHSTRKNRQSESSVFIHLNKYSKMPFFLKNCKFGESSCKEAFYVTVFTGRQAKPEKTKTETVNWAYQKHKHLNIIRRFVFFPAYVAPIRIQSFQAQAFPLLQQDQNYYL